MTTHHTSLYDDKTNPAPNGVLKQELVTLEQTPDGIRDNPPQAAFLWRSSQ